MKKRIFSIFLALVLIIGSATPITAATMDSYAGAVTTAWDPISVRSGAGVSYPVVATVPKGSHITLIQRSGDWWYVEYGNNRFGYCHADYITPIEGILKKKKNRCKSSGSFFGAQEKVVCGNPLSLRKERGFPNPPEKKTIAAEG